MADIALGSVGRIIDIALKIKEAVKNVKQNEKECRDIERCVARVTALIKRLDEVTEAMKEEVMHNALEDLAESLQGALDLVTKCQRKHVVRRFIGAGDMAKELRLVQDDILRKVTIGSFATNVVQLGITLMTIAQAAPPPQRHQQGARTEKPSHGGHPTTTGDGLTNFSFSELEVATQNFSKENEIGKSGLAIVYKGLLRNGFMVAVKELQFRHGHDGRILLNEVIIGVKLQHKNVVKTLGYCDDEQTELTEYEGREIECVLIHPIVVTAYLPNGSLDDIVLSGTRRIYWPFYFRIIQGIAHGLHYLHEENVVHLDIKPANILFDSDMNPVIIDFGGAIVLDNEDYIISDRICGTVGYMPPEYIDKSMLSKKYDVFSFGVIILRTIPSAFFKVEFQEKIGYQYGEFEYDAIVQEGVDKRKELFDPTRVEESELTEIARCLKVGHLCIEWDPADRPTMVQVLDMLNGEKELPARKKTIYWQDKRRNPQ